MRKFLFGAVIALGFAFQGEASAVVCQPLMETGVPDQVAYDALQRTSIELNLDYQELCDRYHTGEITVTQECDGYHVSEVDQNGGTDIMVIVDL